MLINLTFFSYTSGKTFFFWYLTREWIYIHTFYVVLRIILNFLFNLTFLLQQME